MTVVDGTVGNGNDTLYFCNEVGRNGKVIGFDIQEQAIVNTKALLNEHSVTAKVQLFQESHEDIKAFVKEPVDIVHFNLGYLPNTDKTIRTTISSTKIAVIRSLELLTVGGVLSMVFYPGHPEGKEEFDVLSTFFSNLDQQYYSVSKTEFINQVNDPPVLVIVEKRK